MADAVWDKLLPKDLIDSAYRSSDGAGMAWPKDDALRVICALQKNSLVVLGVDVWIATYPGPTIPIPFVYDWDIAQGSRLDTPVFTAFEFVQLFEWDPEDRSHGGKPPYFNFTVTSAH